MPVKSKAQLRKFGQLRAEGKISEETFREWTQGVRASRLPEKTAKKGRRSSRVMTVGSVKVLK